MNDTPLLIIHDYFSVQIRDIFQQPVSLFLWRVMKSDTILIIIHDCLQRLLVTLQSLLAFVSHEYYRLAQIHRFVRLTFAIFHLHVIKDDGFEHIFYFLIKLKQHFFHIYC